MVWISGHCHVHMSLQSDLNLGTSWHILAQLKCHQFQAPLRISFQAQAIATVLWPSLPRETMRHLGIRRRKSHAMPPSELLVVSVASCQPVQCQSFIMCIRESHCSHEDPHIPPAKVPGTAEELQPWTGHDRTAKWVDIRSSEPYRTLLPDPSSKPSPSSQWFQRMRTEFGSPP